MALKIKRALEEVREAEFCCGFATKTVICDWVFLWVSLFSAVK
jgi:hypothetical protein